MSAFGRILNALSLYIPSEDTETATTHNASHQGGPGFLVLLPSVPRVGEAVPCENQRFPDEFYQGGGLLRLTRVAERPEINDFRPFFFGFRGWRWLAGERFRTSFKHTFGHNPGVYPL